MDRRRNLRWWSVIVLVVVSMVLNAIQSDWWLVVWQALALLLWTALRLADDLIDQQQELITELLDDRYPEVNYFGKETL